MNEYLGPYRLLELLGQGGMGEVHLAEDTRTGERVAIKTLLSSVLDDERHVERFQQEMRLQQEIDVHPNVVRLVEVLLRPEVPRDAVVMEYVEGSSLHEVLRRGPVEIERGLRLALAMARALAHVHRHGLLHRDFKPSNVVLAEGEQRPVLLDFGIAREVRPLDDLTRLTETGQVVGTAEYMSPEQAQAGTLTPATDIFSFGVVCYQVFTGISPFRGATPQETSAKTLYHHPVPAHQQRDLVPEALSDLLDRALAKYAPDRPRSMDSVADELQRFIDDPSLLRPRTASPSEASKTGATGKTEGVVPAHTVPAHTVPAHTVPAHTVPAHTVPTTSSDGVPPAPSRFPLALPRPWWLLLGAALLVVLVAFFWPEPVSVPGPVPGPEVVDPSDLLVILPFADGGGERAGGGAVLAVALGAELEAGGVRVIDPETAAGALVDLGLESSAFDPTAHGPRLLEYWGASALVGGTLHQEERVGGLNEADGFWLGAGDGAATPLGGVSGIHPAEMAGRVAQRVRDRWGLDPPSHGQRARAREALPSEIEARGPFALGLLALGRQRPALAQELLLRARELDGGSPAVRMALVRTLLELRFDERARELAEPAASEGSEAPRPARELAALAAEARGDRLAAARLWQGLAEDGDPEARWAWLESLGAAEGPVAALGQLEPEDGALAIPGLRARAHWELRRADYGAARQAAEAFLAEARRLGARRSEILALLYRGIALRGIGETGEAVAAIDRARSLLAEVEDPLLEIQALDWTAILFVESGQPESAITLYDRILELYAQLAGPNSGTYEVLEALARANQGRAFYASGRLAEAEPLLESARRILVDAGTLREAGGALVNLGVIHHLNGRLPSAAELYAQGLDLASRVQARDVEATALGNLGEIELASGEAERGFDLLEQGLEIWRDQLGSLGDAIYLLVQIGEGRLAQGQPELAAEAFAEAVDFSRRLESPDPDLAAQARDGLERSRAAR